MSTLGFLSRGFSYDLVMELVICAGMLTFRVTLTNLNEILI